jgi:hypothetical protein
VKSEPFSLEMPRPKHWSWWLFNKSAVRPNIFGCLRSEDGMQCVTFWREPPCQSQPNVLGSQPFGKPALHAESTAMRYYCAWPHLTSATLVQPCVQHPGMIRELWSTILPTHGYRKGHFLQPWRRKGRRVTLLAADVRMPSHVVMTALETEYKHPNQDGGISLTTRQLLPR